MKKNRQVFGVVLFCCLHFVSGFGQREDRRPNILLINTDDQPSWWVGVYGNPEIHTPVMDKMAAEGMLFTDAF